ncbi:hypothetical protein, partial [Sinorhizobium sp. GL28]|uniref:hypothetical protein n=1 Tax=Sinorhizobium sp. GL28 TaxID=1358418 RepID=UPI000A97F9E1
PAEGEVFRGIRLTMDQEFLKAGNPSKIASAYSSFLSPADIDKIKTEARKHSAAMYNLGITHYRFAINLKSPHWRQKISRLYYASYNASKAIRFDNDGNHSTDVKDHSKIGALPNNFPNKATYENTLSTLRDDRNSCDYDHLAKATDLINTTSDYSRLVTSFLRDAHDYLTLRGVQLGKKI